MDARFRYVPFKELRAPDRLSVTQGNRYPHAVEHLPDEEYLYPVKKDGALASARRHMPYERAKELWDLWQVREVLES